MLPVALLNDTPAPFPLTWIFAVNVVSVPAVLMIDPVVLAPAVMLTAGLAVDHVIIALAPKFTLTPPLKVIVPYPLLTVEVMVKVPLAPLAVMLTVPAPATITGAVMFTAPADAFKVIFPEVLALTPLLTVKVPVLSVKLKLMPLNRASTSVEVGLLLVILYVVIPSPLSKLMACVVLSSAVTVKFARVAEPLLPR
jgi:hypothetical protein